jgi:hypothetical protein
LISPLTRIPKFSARLGLGVAVLELLAVDGFTSAVTTLVKVEVDCSVLLGMLSVVKVTDVVALRDWAVVEVMVWLLAGAGAEACELWVTEASVRVLSEIVVDWRDVVSRKVETVMSVRLRSVVAVIVPWTDEVGVRSELVVEVVLPVTLTTVMVVVEAPSAA